MVEVKYKRRTSDIAKVSKKPETLPRVLSRAYKVEGVVRHRGFQRFRRRGQGRKKHGLIVLQRVGQVVNTDTKEMQDFGFSTPKCYLIRSCLRFILLG